MAVRTPAGHPCSPHLFPAGELLMTDDKDNNVVHLQIPAPRLEQDADAHARADTERRQRLFDWAAGVLAKLGLDEAIAAARSIEALRGITLDLTNAEIALAIRDALHPAVGKPAAHFRGLKEGALKQILQNRFADMKRTREAKLRGNKQRPDWTDDLIRDKDGKVKPLLANLVLTLREAPRVEGCVRIRRVQRARRRRQSVLAIEGRGRCSLDRSAREPSAYLVSRQRHLSGDRRYWPRDTDRGSRQHVQSAARSSQHPRLGQDAAWGNLAAKNLPRRGQPIHSRCRVSMVDRGSRPRLQPRLPSRQHARPRRPAGQVEVYVAAHARQPRRAFR